MRTLARLLSILGLFAASAGWCRAEPPATAPVPSATAPAPADEGWFHWPALPPWPWITGPSFAPEPDDDSACEFPHWYMPVELYAKAGPIVESGNARLSNILKIGSAWEIGAKNYCYDPDRHAAWLGILGLDFQFNEARGRDNLIIHHGVPDALDWVFRIYGRIGIGREWYYRGDDIPDAWRYVFGVDAAALIGHAHEHFKVAPVRDITAAGTVVRTFDITDFALGATVGAHVGVVIPMRRSDLIFACHLDYEHEWSDLVDNDKHLDEFILLLSASIRW